jgi:hypothetical protein
MPYFNAALNGNASRPAIYRRPTVPGDCPLDVTLDDLQFRSEEGTGQTVDWTGTSIGFDAESLVIGGRRVEPEPGDLVLIEISVSGAARTQRFEIVSPLGAQCFAYLDPEKTRIEAHAQEINAAVV